MMSETNRAGDHARTGADAPTNKNPAELSKFQLRILAVLNDAEEAPKGVEVKRRLREYYESEVNHGRLYPNLDKLVSDDFVAKGHKDRRTNAYEITDAGRNALASEVAWLAERAGDVLEEEA